ncbi:MAG TPA: SDR family oxidoreductase [Mycobacteriales bacterium]|nr:SDR family oxidoreductase [Mycobacteriales bacterium]
MTGRLEGKTALITGGSNGLGAAMARCFAAESARVIMTDVEDDSGHRIAAELGTSATYRHLDVTSETDWAAVIGSLDRLHVLVNNAGTWSASLPIEECRYADHQRVMATNLDGTWLGMSAALPLMKAGGVGSIINISSMGGLAGIAGMSSYVASKWAIVGLTRAIALEAGRWGIRVNAIHPGFIRTRAHRDSPPEVAARFERYLDRQAMPHMGEPDDIARLALFLASEESKFSTGSSFIADGGHLAGPYREGFDDRALEASAPI